MRKQQLPGEAEDYFQLKLVMCLGKVSANKILLALSLMW